MTKVNSLNNDDNFSFRWGIPILDGMEDEGLYVPGFMLNNFAKVGATQEEFLIIIFLAAKHYESKRGKSKPSLQAIAKTMGLKTRQRVIQLIQSLEKKELLDVKRTPGERSEYCVQKFAQACLKLWEENTSKENYTSEENCTTPIKETLLLPVKKIAPKEEEVEEKETKKNKGTGTSASSLPVLSSPPEKPTKPEKSAKPAAPSPPSLAEVALIPKPYDSSKPVRGKPFVLSLPLEPYRLAYCEGLAFDPALVVGKQVEKLAPGFLEVQGRGILPDELRQLLHWWAGKPDRKRYGTKDLEYSLEDYAYWVSLGKPPQWREGNGARPAAGARAGPSRRSVDPRRHYGDDGAKPVVDPHEWDFLEKPTEAQGVGI